MLTSWMNREALNEIAECLREYMVRPFVESFDPRTLASAALTVGGMFALMHVIARVMVALYY